MNGEVIFVPMGHCKVTTNTTDMHSQTEVQCKLTDIANSNMHSIKFVESGEHLREESK